MSIGQAFEVPMCRKVPGNMGLVLPFSVPEITHLSLLRLAKSGAVTSKLT